MVFAFMCILTTLLLTFAYRAETLCYNLFSVLLFLLAEVLHFLERAVAAGSPVKFLLGFKGLFPFELESG